ncbi:MAG TPA: SGNH/GDSL hydrolase family protein [Pilimelia sp.]|nr:SGNH/GDSL hydrolase family protein [Pilimelia sp.]
MGWQRYVAVGDSFTEGLDDPYPQGGGFRGWADLIAARLAALAGPGFGYANLAVRGRLFDPIVTEQVPAALTLTPDLVSFAAGGNDVLRRRCDPHALVARLDTVIADIRATGADVVMFRFADLTARLPGQRLLSRRVAVLNRGVGETAERHGARLVDLWADEEFANPLLWSADRLHLSAAGHRRAAAHVLSALGVASEAAWFEAPARPVPVPWLSARRDDLRWAGQHLAPWVKRRLTGRSSGDNVLPKRPTLGPLDRPMTD